MKKTRLIAGILILAMLLPMVFIPVSAEEAVVKESDFVVGETVYTPELKGSGSGVPEGWMAVPEGQIPWPNGGAAGGLQQEKAQHQQGVAPVFQPCVSVRSNHNLLCQLSTWNSLTTRTVLKWANSTAGRTEA